MFSIIDPATGTLSASCMIHILATIAEGVVILNEHHRVIYANSACSTITQFPQTSLIGLPGDELIYCASYTYRSFFDAQGVQRVPCLLVTTEGKKLPVLLTSTPLSEELSKPHTLWVIERQQERFDNPSLLSTVVDEPLLQTQSAPMQKVIDLILAMASQKHPLLFVGESGTGKKSFAFVVHRKTRGAQPFIAFDVSAFSENVCERELFGYALHAFSGAEDERAGALENVQEGTLFLAEIDALSPFLQRKMVRLLREGLFERMGERVGRMMTGRLIASTTKDLAPLVRQGLFSEELYHLLAPYSVKLPPLRERKEDLPQALMSNLLLAQKHRGTGATALQPEAFELCRNYTWPGNFHELKRVIDQASFVCSGAIIEASHLPTSLWKQTMTLLPKPVDLPSGKRKDLSKEELQLILHHFDNKSDVARYLGVERTTLWRWIKKYDLEAGEE